MDEEVMMKKAMIISCFSWYENRLKPIKEHLQEWYEVHCFTSDFIHTTKEYVGQKNPDLEYVHVPAYRKNISIKRFISYICFGKEIERKLRELNPDLVYLVLPPNNTAYWCLKYKKKHPDCKYYIDIIDLWPESMPLNEKYNKSILFKQWAGLRDESIRTADHVFVECNYYREQLRGKLNEANSTVLYLTRGITNDEKQLVESKYRRREDIKSRISLCYLGSINHIIDIDKICKLIEELNMRSIDVELKIVGDGESKDELILKTKAVGAKVEYYGKVYDQVKKIELIGSCDYGLNIYISKVAVGLTIKSIDYFSMGIPIINTIKGDTWEMVANKQVGINCDDCIKECVDAMLNLKNDYWKNAYELYWDSFSHEAFYRTIDSVFANKGFIDAEK